MLLQCYTRIFKACGASSQLCDKPAAQMSATPSSGVAQSGAALTASASESRQGHALFPPGGERCRCSGGVVAGTEQSLALGLRCERNHLTQRRCFRQPSGRVPEPTQSQGCSLQVVRAEHREMFLGSPAVRVMDGRLLGTPALRVMDERLLGSPGMWVVDKMLLGLPALRVAEEKLLGLPASGSWTGDSWGRWICGLWTRGSWGRLSCGSWTRRFWGCLPCGS